MQEVIQSIFPERRIMTIYDILAICMLVAVFWPVNPDTLREIDNIIFRTH